MKRVFRYRHVVVLVALLLAMSPVTVTAQSTSCAPPTPVREWVRLCADGNGLPMLRRPIELHAATMSVADALREIARVGGMNITFDATLSALRQVVNVPAGQRTVAQAFLEVANARAVEIDVGVHGELIVVAAPPTNRGGVASVSDSVRHAALLARVVVTAARDEARATSPLSTVTYREPELALAPGFFGNDPLRAARLLPGLAARNDFSTSLNARGGESDQTLVMLDGIPIYYPFHLGGLLSTFIDPAVGALDLFTGVFPSRYNGRLSALLDVRSAEAVREGVHGTVDVSLLASSASIGGATHDASTSWLVAGRRTYADAIARLAQQRLPYHFQDGNLHVSHRLRGGSLVRLTAYGGGDYAAYSDASDTLGVSAMNAAMGLSWSGVSRRETHIGSLHLDSAAFAQRVSISAFDAAVALQSDGADARSHVRDIRYSGALTTFAGRGAHTLGYELAEQRTTYDVSLPYEALRNLAPAGHADGKAESASGWYDATWRVSPSLLVQGGERIDLVRGVGTLLSPRLSTRLQLSPALAFTAAVGR
jgi:hypothetical protein